ncbi:MAG: epoxyqueuosine reductase QueH [Heliobacteriaceae bacterium]|jgi:predicted adenine nucleotide alpha hydrolase (AANH) superfamily ATPase|nr:epoxyqueuosine reductase QueH [Heliobacteriaceae bacterium]
MTILLHTCCAICSGYPIKHLQDIGYNVSAYFYNPNIFPKAEYEKRLEAQRILCGHLNCELIEAEYEPQDFLQAAKGLEKEPEKGRRCDKCFELRLRKTAQKAQASGIKYFSTSIPISPHKDYKKITQIGLQIAGETGLTYVAIDFKKKDGFLKTNKTAKELGLYRQNYCGCRINPEFPCHSDC